MGVGLVRDAVTDAPTHSATLHRLDAAVERYAFAIVIGAVVAYCTYFSWFTVLNHATYHTFAYDLGIYMQSLWTTVHGYGLFYTSLWEGSRFAYHFEPVLFALVPLYAAFPRAETLLILQSAALGLGAIPVYLLARRHLGNVVGLGFVLLYLMSPSVHSVNGFDFHATALAVPLLLSTYYLLSAGRLRLGVLFALVALICRENVAPVVFLMGAYWAWRWRRQDMLTVERSALPRDRRFLVALSLCLVAVMWFVLAVNVAIPSFAQSAAAPALERYQGAFGNFGVDARGKLLYLLQIFGPLVFLPILAPCVLVIGASVFAENLLSFGAGMYQLTNHYVALLIPILFVAGIEGMTVLTGRVRPSTIRLRYFIMLLMLVSTSTFALLYSNSPISLGRGFPVVDEHVANINRVIELLPAEASVFSENDLFPHVCHRREAYSIPFKFKLDFFRYDLLYGRTIVTREDSHFDYVLMDIKSDQAMSRFMTAGSWQTLRSDYGLYAKVDGVLLYKRGFTGKPVEMSSAGYESFEQVDEGELD